VGTEGNPRAEETPDFRAHLLSGPKIDGLEIDRPRDSDREVDLLAGVPIFDPWTGRPSD